MSTDSANQLHRESLVIDGLNASWFLDDGVIERLHDGGVTAVNATIAAWHDPAETLDMIGRMLEQIERHHEIALQVRHVEDIHTAKAAGKVGFILGFQDTAPIDDKLHLLRVYHELGVRIIQLTYNFENGVGYGCQAHEDRGLTPFGRDVVAEMNRLGILIDLSHCGPRTTLEAIGASNAPTAITHANATSQSPHARNKTDEALLACAAGGGVIGALAVPVMLTEVMPATLADYINAIDYLVNLVGVHHVGVGPDFMEEMPAEVVETVLRGLPPEAIEFLAAMPAVEDFASVRDMPNVTKALIDRDYRRDAVQQIMGANWLRLYEAVWQ